MERGGEVEGEGEGDGECKSAELGWGLLRRTVPSRRARRCLCAPVQARQRHCAAPVQLGHSGAYEPDLGL